MCGFRGVYGFLLDHFDKKLSRTIMTENVQNALIGCSPFFANYGFNPAFDMEPDYESKVEAVDPPSESPEDYLVDGAPEWKVEDI
ncbi:hypothetical protein L0F63_003886, partial [Massospora cicadina]